MGLTQEQEDALFKRFPTIFPNGRNVNPMDSLMCYGCEIPKAWYNLLWKLCEEIEQYCDGVNVYAVQVKSKFGSIRFYTTPGPAEMFDVIRHYESLSEHTCEVCGERGNLTQEFGWVYTLCDKHVEEKRKERTAIKDKQAGLAEPDV